MSTVLQWLGGGFYLLNKVFFSISERARSRGDLALWRTWRILAWSVYLVGLPPWIILFVGKHDWIAASVEASGTPAMLLGLVLAIHGKDASVPSWLKILANACIVLGFVFSLFDFHGLHTLSQWLETGLVAGFLVGTYELAHERSQGYLWYVLMHVSCAYLMWIQGFPWLVAQQVFSLLFIVDAFLTQRRRTTE